MSKKGFTLIELLAVITLLGVLSLIATVTINNTLKESRKDACETQLKNIASGAKNWASKNVFELPSEDGSSITVSLGELKLGGFVDKDITNPITEQLFSDDIKITITRVDNNYEYEVGAECQ